MQHHSSLAECLYQDNNIPDILRLYQAKLQKSEDFKSLSHARAIGLYRDIITDKKFLAVLRKEFEYLYSILEKELPDIRFTIVGRRKSVISAEKKLLKLLNENKSIDLFRDSFAFRIVLFGNMPEIELIKRCYSVMNRIISYYGVYYTLCEADTVSDTMDPTSEAYSQLVIPSKSEITQEFLHGVKDYILHPKDNGYQSLHCVFRTQSGTCFEVQVRTFSMDISTVEGIANHGAYKKTKYPYDIEFDRSKIHIPGYHVSKSGTVFDLVGLEEPLSIFYRSQEF